MAYPFVGVCMLCRKKNEAANKEYRLMSVRERLMRMTSDAGKPEKEACQREISKNPYLRSMCETHMRCSYGRFCPGLKSSSLNMLGREVSELLVLAKVMGANIYSLRGNLADYPKAVKFIVENRPAAE